MKIEYWKYEGKEISEIAKIDPNYLIWVFWEKVRPWKGDNRDLLSEIEIELKNIWKTIFESKERLFDKVLFWKHKWKKYEDLIQKEGKWFLWMYNEVQDSDLPDMDLVFTLRYWMTKNWCTLFDGSFGMRYCPSCKSMHIKK